VVVRRIKRWLVIVCVIGISPCAVALAATESNDNPLRTASLWNLFGRRENPVYDSLPGNVTPHPAVARIIVPEDGATAFGSGTLVAVNDKHGLVVTNWHVVRDGVGLVDVVFPDGFHSHARPIKVDSDWDLAALVVWRPNVEPVKIAAQPPRPGELLTIHGYGRGQYRVATGHCTTYYAPRVNYPHEMVELDVEARQGDSGGPIFNQAGELAGVLFGAGQGTTLGSFSPRVRYFLATAVPDFEKSTSSQIVAAERPASLIPSTAQSTNTVAATLYPSSPWSPTAGKPATKEPSLAPPQLQLAGAMRSQEDAKAESATPSGIGKSATFEPIKTLLAVIGLTAITLRALKVAR
jgi:hypothetical protein